MKTNIIRVLVGLVALGLVSCLMPTETTKVVTVTKIKTPPSGSAAIVSTTVTNTEVRPSAPAGAPMIGARGEEAMRKKLQPQLQPIANTPKTPIAETVRPLSNQTQVAIPPVAPPPPPVARPVPEPRVPVPAKKTAPPKAERMHPKVPAKPVKTSPTAETDDKSEILPDELQKKIAPLLIEGQPLAWVDQEDQQIMLIIRQGSSVHLIHKDWCTTGRNSAAGGESLPTPSTVDSGGNITFTTVVRKDEKRPGLGLRYAMELDIRNIRGELRSICIHVGTKREYPASHGCIRVSEKTARLLYAKMPEGSRVVITGTAESDNPYVVYVPQGPSGEQVAVFKCAIPGATQEDITAFKELLRNKGVPLDNGPFGKLSTDKEVIRFRFEHMPSGSGITVAEVERILRIRMNIDPARITKQPRKA